jgi:hypothetical protein
MRPRSHSLSLRGSCPHEFCSTRWWDERTVCTGISTSKLQARAEVEAVTLNALANAEVVNPTRAKVEVALPELGGVCNDRTNAEGAADKTVEHRRCAYVVVDLLNPAFDEADAEAVLEAFDGEHFQVGQNAVLITRCVIRFGRNHTDERSELHARNGSIQAASTAKARLTEKARIVSPTKVRLNPVFIELFLGLQVG